MIYRAVFSLVLTRIPAEAAHALAARSSRLIGALPIVRRALRRLLAADDPRLRVRALGLTFPNPLGVAAGMDKDATWFETLGAYGFGHVEVGTVTAVGQAGNPPPTIARLLGDRALLNSMGFPNAGAQAVAGRLRRRSGETIVGVNIGKSRITPLEDAGRDYRASVRRLAPLADYLVLNVSSPNTPQLREMQAVDRLGALVEDVTAELRAIGVALPLLVKLAPDLSDAEIDELADAALAWGLDGIVAVNTTISREGLVCSDAELLARPGGISGAPLAARSLAVLRRLRARTGDRLVLVSVGGIATADDVWERLVAGASLVQVHTGFVYEGPLWPSRINRGLLRRLDASGAASVQELIGSGAPGAPRVAAS